MGYFANGEMGLAYSAEYCEKCINYEGCWVFGEHLTRNYKECNDPNSILHVLIPKLDKSPWNGKCVMFRESVGRSPWFDKAQPPELRVEPHEFQMAVDALAEIAENPDPIAQEIAMDALNEIRRELTLNPK